VVSERTRAPTRPYLKTEKAELKRGFWRRLFGHHALAPEFRWLKAEYLTAERIIPVAVTRHLEMSSNN
jgi:hypothetical protein